MCIKEAGSWFGKIERDSPYWVSWIDSVDLEQKRSTTEMTWHEIHHSHNDSSIFCWEKNLLSSRELTYPTRRKPENPRLKRAFWTVGDMWSFLRG